MAEKQNKKNHDNKNQTQKKPYDQISWADWKFYGEDIDYYLG